MTIITVLGSDADSVVANTNWTEVASSEFTIDGTSEFVIFISCEFTNAATNRIAGVRILLDGVERAFTHGTPVVANEFMVFAPILVETINAGLHTLTIEARTSNIASATTIRRKRLVVMKH